MVALTLLFVSMLSFAEASSMQVGANPIRKIVGLLQGMQKEIETEGEKEQKAYDKFMCYCDGNSGSMSSGAADGKQMAEKLSSKLADLEAQKSQMVQELKAHHESRDAAKQDLVKGQNIRNNENEEFVAASTDMAANIKAMKGAVSALEKGGGAFVQMGSESKARITQLIEGTSQVDDFEKTAMQAFLQGKASDSSTGQITGMLKAMQEEMEGDLKTAESDEATAVTGFQELTAAKESEISAASSAIEAKTKRSGELAVEIVQTKDDVEDTNADVAETEGFLGNLREQCAAKKAEWSERQKMRSEEVAAISQAVKILNDDSALDLFKKTASFAQEGQQGMRFLQKSSMMSSVRRAHSLLATLSKKSTSHSAQMALIASALKSKSVDFSKITEMIKGMVEVLGAEQKDDDTQLAFCKSELSKSAQNKKETEGKIASLEASLEDMSATVSTLASEIANLQTEIKTLDTAVAQATEQRKSEHATHTSAQAENQAATELVEKAKNRLFQFYRPSLHVAEERRELTEEEQIAISAGGADPRDVEEASAAAQANLPTFVQVRAHTTDEDAAVPPPPPETFGAYSKKDNKSNGVIGLMDMMIEELKTDYTDAEHAEALAQKDYEHLMSSSQKSRATAAKSITEKESAKAEWTEKIENSKTSHASTTDALLKLNEFIAGLHSQCDFLLENASMRAEARTNEIEGLKNAAAVLAGASME